MKFLKSRTFSVLMYIFVSIFIIVFSLYNVIYSLLSLILNQAHSTIVSYLVVYSLVCRISVIVIMAISTVYAFVWLVVRKMHKVKTLNSIMLCIAFWMFGLNFQTFVNALRTPSPDFATLSAINMNGLLTLFATLTFVILFLYVNNKTPYLKKNKYGIYDWLLIAFSVLYVILYVTSPFYEEYMPFIIVRYFLGFVYPLIFVILYATKKGYSFEIPEIIAVSILLFIITKGTEVYFVNILDGLIYEGAIGIRDAIDLLNENFNYYKDIMKIKIAFNVQHYAPLCSFFPLSIMAYFKNKKQKKIEEELSKIEFKY